VPVIGDVTLETLKPVSDGRAYLKICVSANQSKNNFRVAGHPTRIQLVNNKSRRIGKMLATITNPFGPCA
jgi:hypothetical protein